MASRVARVRYYLAIRYAVKAPQENTMVEILIAAVLGLFGGAKAEKIEVEISTAQDIEEAEACAEREDQQTRAASKSKQAQSEAQSDRQGFTQGAPLAPSKHRLVHHQPHVIPSG